MTSCRSSSPYGFTRCASNPAARIRSRSLRYTSAVRAMIGTRGVPPSARICSHSQMPSSIGMAISVTTTVDGDALNRSSASRAPAAAITVAPAWLSEYSSTSRPSGSSSTSSTDIPARGRGVLMQGRPGIPDTVRSASGHRYGRIGAGALARDYSARPLAAPPTGGRHRRRRGHRPRPLSTRRRAGHGPHTMLESRPQRCCSEKRL